MDISQPKEYCLVNFELTKQLYDAFLESEANKFIFISSVKAAADHIDIPLKKAISQILKPITASLN